MVIVGHTHVRLRMEGDDVQYAILGFKGMHGVRRDDEHIAGDQRHPTTFFRQDAEALATQHHIDSD